MNDAVLVFTQLRAWCSQILVLQFASWITMMPFVYFAVNEVVKILKRIK